MKRVIIIFSIVASICAAIAGLFAYLTFNKRKRYASLTATDAIAEALKEKIKNAPTMTMEELEALCE